MNESDELTILGDILDMNRAVAVKKIDGLSLEDARRVCTPSGLSPLGTLQHLAWVEYNWFRLIFSNEGVAMVPRGEHDNSIQFVLDDTATIDSVVAFYLGECEHAREVVAGAASLDVMSVNESRMVGRRSLRWILVHMIEETARHAGHLDIMRESIDGAVGYL